MNVAAEDSSNDVKISILVPVKDEADSLDQLAKEVILALDGPGRESWELVFVDDGSIDNTWAGIVELARTDRRIRGIRFRRNFGKSAALAAGFASSTGAIVVTLDGDLQDDPAEIPAMLARLDEPADLVAGYKAERRDPLGKRLASKVFNFFTGVVTGLRLKDHNCGLKVARREAFASVPLYGEMHRYIAAIAYAEGFRVVEQPVHHRPRVHGRSKFGLERYARGGLDLLTVVGLTRYTQRPAHLFGGIGLALGVAGMAILIYLSGIWLFTDQGIGNRPLLLLGVLLVLVAVQLASIGLLAEMMLSRDASGDYVLRHITEHTTT